jgi:hypothetical protein
MIRYLLKLAIYALILCPAPALAEDLTHYVSTVYFNCDFESGYQYMGAGNAHAGGGYFSHMGGSIARPEDTGCSDPNNYHNTIISSGSDAGGAVYNDI